MKQLLVTSLTVLALLTSSSMGAITPINGVAAIDGNPGEWDTSVAGVDFASHMYEAGNPTKEVLSNLYMRYDCQSHILYSLVLVEDGYTAVSNGADAWIKIYDIQQNPLVDGNSGNDGTPPDFQWITESTNYVGYEAAIELNPGSYPYTYDELEVHINILGDDGGGRTSSTGKRDYLQSLTLDCNPPAVPAPGAFLLAGIGSSLVGYMRRRKTL